MTAVLNMVCLQMCILGTEPQKNRQGREIASRGKLPKQFVPSE